MNRTFLVLALTVCSTVGCRAFGPNGNCGGCGDACHVSRSQHAPRPMGCGDACGPGRGGTCGECIEGSCVGQGCGDCQLFQRYCGPACDGNCGNACGTTGGNCPCTSCGNRGFGPGEYDCSPCGSPDWGANGFRRPWDSSSNCRTCDDGSGRPHGISPAICGGGYCCPCCGKPAPGCCCCNSGDQNYNFTPGPPVAQTAYPYYTVRGPRDYLLANPPSIGPY